jgi:hypothetical protein
MPAQLLSLQQGIGNHAVTAMIARGRQKGGATKTATKPKKPKLTEAEKLALELTSIRAAADKASARADKSATAAELAAAGVPKVITDCELLITDPLVAANADVLSDVKLAAKECGTARDEAERQAAAARRSADTAATHATTAGTTGTDDWTGNNKVTQFAKSANSAADLAEAARKRADKELAGAKQALVRAGRAKDLVAHAKTWVEGSSGDADVKAGKAIKDANTWNIDATRLKQLRGDAKRKVVDEQWRARRGDLQALDEEAERVLGFVSQIDDAETRAGSLAHTDAVAVRSLITAARIELQKSPRDDVASRTKLDAIGTKLDQLDDAAALLAGTQAARQQLIAEGRLASNKTEIAAQPLAGLAGEEKTAVDEILDAFNDGDAASPFGGKWNEYHGNNAGDLPGVRGGGGYAEYYVKAALGQAGWGLRRLVRHPATSRWYYSRTHYGLTGAPAFVLLTGT